MNMRKCVAPLLAAGVFLVAFAARGEEAGVYERIAKGPDLLWDNCTDCHELDWPLGKTATRSEWEETLKTMEGKGAILDQGDKESILDYLVAKSLFETRCTACHGTEKSLTVRKNREEWSKTVQDMVDRKPESFAAGEKEAIAGYLAVERGPEESQ